MTSGGLFLVITSLYMDNTMNNRIVEDQNTQQQLDRLAARRYVYSQSKILLALQMLLTLAFPITLTISATIVQNLKVWAAFYGIIISFMDVAVIEQCQKSWKTLAAKIQELFDCDVLKIEWNDLKTGNRPDNETIHEKSERFKNKNPECKGLNNWYPVAIKPLPLHLARLVCQRTNCWWNWKLRQRYKQGLYVAVIVVILTLLVIGIQTKMTMEGFILRSLAPISPMILWVLREIYKQRESATALVNLKNYTESIWTKALNKELTQNQLEQISRDIQNEIFDRRRNDPVIFDWLYWLFRNKQEVQMDKSAEQLAKDALNSLTVAKA